MQGDTVIHFSFLMNVIRVGGPHEIMHLGRFEFPGEFGCFGSFHHGTIGLVSITDLQGILQIAGSTQNIISIDFDVHFEIAPNAIEFPSHIRRGVPSLIIILAKFGIPLTHGISNFRGGIVPSAASDLQRHLRLEFHLQFHLGTRQDGFIQYYLQDGFQFAKLLRPTIQLQRTNTLVSDLIRFQVGDAIAYAHVPICSPTGGNGSLAKTTHIHHTARLKSIEIEMIEKFVKCIGRIVPIVELLLSGELVGRDIHIDVHFIIHPLLPTIGLRPSGQTQKTKCKKQGCNAHTLNFIDYSFPANTITISPLTPFC